MKTSRKSTRSKKPRKKLTADQIRFNRESAKIKGKPGSKEYKKYIFGHYTNVRKGNA